MYVDEEEKGKQKEERKRKGGEQLGMHRTREQTGNPGFGHSRIRLFPDSIIPGFGRSRARLFLGSIIFVNENLHF
jgi:hypothetical protein